MLGRRRRRKKAVPHLEVSLTPLIDVALTLLIIFMVTTPMIQNAIKIDLPKGQAKEGGHEQQELVVSIDKSSNMYLNKDAVSLADLGQAVRKQIDAQGSRQDKRVWVKVDGSCPTNSLIAAIDCIKVVGGVKDVAIATEQSSGAVA